MYDERRRREKVGLTDENNESPVGKKLEELERASGEIKCAECRHVFELDELFGICQCPKCYKVFCDI
jgi:Zn finger protein HypA/HybF involved in hydrogenase expression